MFVSSPIRKWVCLCAVALSGHGFSQDAGSSLPSDIPALHTFCAAQRNVDLAGRIVYDEKGVEIFNFGRFKGKPVAEVFRTEIGYYDWMMNGDFPSNTKTVITRLRLKEFNNKK